MSSIDTQNVCGFHLVLRENMRRVLHPALVALVGGTATGLRKREIGSSTVPLCVFDILLLVLYAIALASSTSRCLRRLASRHETIHRDRLSPSIIALRPLSVLVC